MNTSTDTGDGTTAAPNHWHHQQRWRTRYPWDTTQAHDARLALASLQLYPTADLSTDPGLATQEANLRAALHHLVDQLDRTDLRAIYQLTRLLALIPRHPTLLPHIAQHIERTLTAHGL